MKLKKSRWSVRQGIHLISCELLSETCLWNSFTVYHVLCLIWDLQALNLPVRQTILEDLK